MVQITTMQNITNKYDRFIYTKKTALGTYHRYCILVSCKGVLIPYLVGTRHAHHYLVYLESGH